MYANGDVYAGDWKDDQRHGHGEVCMPLLATLKPHLPLTLRTDHTVDQPQWRLLHWELAQRQAPRGWEGSVWGRRLHL